MSRTFTVYKGELAGKIVYIGTTVQEPADRFRWHKANGKDFIFTVLSTHTDEEEMLDQEFTLIQLHKPRFNKITDRKQNFNAKLSADALKAREGDKQWCQKCLKRRVNVGYKHCYWCN